MSLIRKILFVIFILLPISNSFGAMVTEVQSTKVSDGNIGGETPNTDEIVSGMSAGNHIVEEDRKEAIKIALMNSQPEDVIVVAGKGHETTQEIAGEFFDFDDKVRSDKVTSVH